MLPHYSPLKRGGDASASSAASTPGRIDLGIGRAPGTDQLTMLALQRDRRQPAPDDFPAQLTELLAYLEDRMPADHPFARLAASLPGRARAARGLAAGLLAPERDLGRRARPPLLVRRLHQPAGGGDRGRLPAPLRGRGALTRPARGRRGGRGLRRHRRGGRAAGGQRPDGVLAAAPGPADPGAAGREGAALPRRRARRRPPSGAGAIIGSPETVREGLEEVAREYGAEEVTVVTITHEHEARRRSYELIAEAFELSAAPAAAAVAQP